MSDETKKKAKLWGGLSVGGFIAFIAFFFGYVDRSTEKVQAQVEKYVDTRHEGVIKKLDSIEKTLFRIEDRVYELTKDKNE